MLLGVSKVLTEKTIFKRGYSLIRACLPQDGTGELEMNYESWIPFL